MAWGGSEPWVVAAAGRSEAGSAGWDRWRPRWRRRRRRAGTGWRPWSCGSAERAAAGSSPRTSPSSGAARADDVVRIANALAPTHDLVLVTAPGGLLAPLGDYTLADIAWVLRSPVVIAADTAANQAALTLEVGEPPPPRRRGGGGRLRGRVRRVAGRCRGRDPARRGGVPDVRRRTRRAGWTRCWAACAGWQRGTGRPSRRPRRRSSRRHCPVAAPVPPAPRLISGKRVAVALLILVIVALQAIYMINVMSRRSGAGLGLRAVRRDRRGGCPHGLPMPVREPVCPEGRLAGVPTVADAATSARVAAAWTRIETFLAARAPATAAALRPGAAPERIAATQARMSVAFPADLVASLSRHDGMSHGRPDRSSRRSTGRSARTRSTGSGGPSATLIAGSPDSGWWHPHTCRSPRTAAATPCSSTGGPSGSAGFDHESGVRFREWPSPFAAFLEAVATSLETGQPYAGRYRPQVGPDGTLGWDA